MGAPGNQPTLSENLGFQASVSHAGPHGQVLTTHWCLEETEREPRNHTAFRNTHENSCFYGLNETDNIASKLRLNSFFSLSLSFCRCLAVLLREEVAQLQEEVHLLRQMKDMLSKDLEESQGSCSADVLSATELRVQLAQKEQELDRAKEALQGGLVLGSRTHAH